MITDPGSEPPGSTLRVALAQIVAGGDPAANLELVADNTARAARRGAQLVLFPEATMRCFGLPLREVAEPVDGQWAKGLRDIADHHALVIIAGMFSPPATAECAILCARSSLGSMPSTTRSISSTPLVSPSPRQWPPDRSR